MTRIGEFLSAVANGRTQTEDCQGSSLECSGALLRPGGAVHRDDSDGAHPDPGGLRSSRDAGDIPCRLPVAHR